MCNICFTQYKEVDHLSMSTKPNVYFVHIKSNHKHQSSRLATPSLTSRAL